jgi:hypothetical protein
VRRSQPRDCARERQRGNRRLAGKLRLDGVTSTAAGAEVSIHPLIAPALWDEQLPISDAENTADEL